MSLFKAVKSVFSGGRSPAGGGGGGEDRLYVVDGERMLEGREVGPGDRFQLLQRLGRFVEREKVRMQVVFSGRPLREVEHGGEFMGIKVFYVEQGQDFSAQFLDTVRDAVRRGKTAGLTNDVELEKKIADLGAVTIRASTLRKGLEGGGGEGGGDRGGDRGERGGEGGGRGGDRGPRRRRGPRGGGRGGFGRPQQQGGNGGGGEGQADQAGGSGDTSSGSSNSVKNLIDLVE